MSLQTAQPLQPRRLDNTVSPAHELFSLWKQGELDMAQPYQRGDVWAPDQRRLFLKSLLQDIPVPAIVVNDRNAAHYRDPLGRPDTRYGIVDGKQRVTTMCMWFDGGLAVPASWFSSADVTET